MNISFKRPEDVLPSAMILAAIAILVIALAVVLFAKVPSAQSVRRSHHMALRNLNDQIHKLDKTAVDAQKEATDRLWTGNPETISTSILGSLTQQAAKLSLQVGSFRPQRTVLLDGMTELPFSVQITGPYKDVRTVLASFDTPSSKVAIESTQIESSVQSSTNDITATVTLEAYMPTQTVVVTPAQTSTAGSKSKRLPPGVKTPRPVSITTTTHNGVAPVEGGAHGGSH